MSLSSIKGLFSEEKQKLAHLVDWKFAKSKINIYFETLTLKTPLPVFSGMQKGFFFTET